jgi:hypothetical protein
MALGSAALPAAPAADNRQAEMVQSLRRDAGRIFELDKKLALDPALRTAADQMSAEHLARLDKLLPAWVEEERKASPSDLYYPVWARLLNEIALWQLDAGDEDYERATLAAIRTSPRVCEWEGDPRFSDFASRMLRLQAMPPAQRTAALATERRLLARWGQQRQAVAPWPSPLPQDAAVALLKREQADKPRPALPPLLAWQLLGEQKAYAALHPAERCAMLQWWLQDSLRHGAKPADALNAFRYGTLITASDRFAGSNWTEEPERKAGAADRYPPYPKLASHFAVTGKTLVEVDLDATGKPRQARIASRQVDVPGIRGVRPVVFENVFDKAALDYAMRLTFDKPKAAGPTKFQLGWHLDGAEQAGDGAQQGAGK